MNKAHGSYVKLDSYFWKKYSLYTRQNGVTHLDSEDAFNGV